MRFRISPNPPSGPGSIFLLLFLFFVFILVIFIVFIIFFAATNRFAADAGLFFLLFLILVFIRRRGGAFASDRNLGFLTGPLARSRLVLGSRLTGRCRRED
jgi:hypothetical protein